MGDKSMVKDLPLEFGTACVRRSERLAQGRASELNVEVRAIALTYGAQEGACTLSAGMFPVVVVAGTLAPGAPTLVDNPIREASGGVPHPIHQGVAATYLTANSPESRIPCRRDDSTASG